MTADEAYRLVQLCVNKQQGGYVSPIQFNLAISQAQRGYMDYLLGEYQRYQMQRPIAVVQFGENQRIQNSLIPFIYSACLNVYSLRDCFGGVYALASYPADYEYSNAMWTMYGHYKIKFIQQDRLDSYVHSAIDRIATNPVYLIRHDGFQFFPDSTTSAKLSYIRTPPPIIWGYTLDGNSRAVYDPFTSQHPVWADTDMMQIIVRALSIIGVNLQAGVVMQYAQNIKDGGQ